MTHVHRRLGGAAALLTALAALGCRESPGTAPDLPPTPPTPPAPEAPALPPTLSVFGGRQTFGLVLGVQWRMPVTLRSARGDSLPLPAGFTLVSRDPALVSVDSGTVIRARAMGATWIVGAVDVAGRVVADSLLVGVVCTSELRVTVTPTSATLAVGESVTPSVELRTCGDQILLADTFRWFATDSAVVRVDSVSGRTTALRAGQATVAARGARYGLVAGIPVTVR